MLKKTVTTENYGSVQKVQLDQQKGVRQMDFFEHYFSVRYGDIVVLLYHDDMKNVVDLLNNKNKHKTLKVFLEYCYMIDVRVLLQGTKGEKTKGLKAAQKTVDSYGIAMTEEQISQMQEAMSSL